MMVIVGFFVEGIVNERKRGFSFERYLMGVGVKGFIGLEILEGLELKVFFRVFMFLIFFF